LAEQEHGANAQGARHMPGVRLVTVRPMSRDPRRQPPSTDAPEATTPKLRCSFCGKSQGEIRKLIAGPNVYICDECVDLCNDILEREAESVSTREEATPVHSIASCALCRLPKDVTELRMIGEKGVLCVECIDTVRSVVESVESDEGTL
jgi:hypothetical protein